MKEPFDFKTGELLLVDKPKDWTSFDAVKKIRNAARVKKVGHGGTLDPLATGLLIVAVGPATKKLQQLQDADKAYQAEIRLGFTTPSYDAEFPPENPKPTGHIAREAVEEAMRGFMGTIEQYPPAYSAVKVGGKRAYDLARKGKEVETKPRQVTIKAFDLLAYDGPERITTQIECSKGTYIRTLAHDLGQALETGAFLLNLRRTRVADFRLEDAWPLDELVAEIRRQREETGE